MLTHSDLNENQIKRSLIGAILATSESIRFRSVQFFITQSQKNINPIIQSWVFSINYKKTEIVEHTMLSIIF